MLLNYIKITLRNLYKERMYAAINISGLSLGIACCIILGLYLHMELTYDRHHLKHERIFRIAQEITTNGRTDSFPQTSSALGPLLAKNYPEIEACVRFNRIRKTIYIHEDKAFFWEDVYMADENVFDVFTHEIIYGNPGTALSDPNSMAVSQAFSRRYFGDANPIGKIITADGVENRITLVFADLPKNTHLRYDVLLSYNRASALPDDMVGLRWELLKPSVFTYLLMSEGYQPQSFQKMVDPIYSAYLEEIEKKIGIASSNWLQPLADIHLNSNLSGDLPTGNKLYIYGLSAVALFILLVACINYMNLATARSMKRGLEVGMRKVLGAGRPQLIAQFLGESLFFTLIALVLGLFLVELAFAFTPVNELLGKQDLISFLDEPVLLFWIFGLGIAVGLFSGIYPALYLSSIFPVSALTGTGRTGRHGFRIRQALVLLQFIISISVISATILMAIQMHYITSKSMGFNKQNQVIINLKGADIIEKFPTLKNELLKDSHILSAAMSEDIPGGLKRLVGIDVENNMGVMERQTNANMVVGEGFISTMGIELVSGRDFTRNDEGISSVIVNETMVKKNGWSEPLGKRVGFKNINWKVIGVVKDFHFDTFHNRIDSLIIDIMRSDFTDLSPAERKNQFRRLVVHMSGEDISGTLNYIQKVYAEFDPGHPFEYEFLTDILDRYYLSEQSLMKLTGIFSGICILISCLGLLGLAAFATEQRTKEIGIRKVLGASTFQIIAMLSRNILIIVLAASVVASLVAYFVIDEWLTGFAYHTGINHLVFVLSAIIAIAVALGVVALQSFRTAQADPVEALRYE